MTLRYSLTEEEIVSTDYVAILLYHDQESIRLAALAYLSQKLDAEALMDLLNQYPNAEGYGYYYFDVVCWLDRILYAPKEIADWYGPRLLDKLYEYTGLNLYTNIYTPRAK